METSGTDAPRRVVFQYLVPVHVEVEDGLVCRVCPSSEVLGQWGFGFSGGLGSSGVDI